MKTVNIHEAKTKLSKLIAFLESGEESAFLICRNGVPVAKLVTTADEVNPLKLHNELRGVSVFGDISGPLITKSGI